MGSHSEGEATMTPAEELYKKIYDLIFLTGIYTDKDKRELILTTINATLQKQREACAEAYKNEPWGTRKHHVYCQILNAEVK